MSKKQDRHSKQFIAFSENKTLFDTCPRCGCSVIIPKLNRNTNCYFVECRECHVRTKETKTIDQAQMEWNSFSGLKYIPVEMVEL